MKNDNKNNNIRSANPIRPPVDDTKSSPSLSASSSFPSLLPSTGAVSIQLLLASFFSTLFACAWILPVVLISVSAVNTLDSTSTLLLRTTGDTITEGLERQFHRAQDIALSTRNFTRNHGSPYASNATLRSYISTSVGYMAETPSRFRYAYFRRFYDGSKSLVASPRPNIFHFQVSQSTGFFNKSLETDEAQEKEKLFNGYAIQLNFTDGALTPSNMLIPNGPRSFLNHSFWFFAENQALAHPDRNFFYDELFYTPQFSNSINVKIITTALAPPSLFPNEPWRHNKLLYYGVESCSFQGLEETLSELLPRHDDPSLQPLRGFFKRSQINVADSKSFLVSPDRIVLATSMKEPPFFSPPDNANVSSPPYNNYRCYSRFEVATGNTQHGCMFNIETHPSYALLKAADAHKFNLSSDEQLRQLDQGFLGDPLTDPNQDDATYLWFRRPVAFSKKLYFTLYVFIPTSLFLGQVQDRFIVMTVAIVVILIIGFVGAYFLLRPIVVILEDLSEKMAKDPFDPSLFSSSTSASPASSRDHQKRHQERDDEEEEEEDDDNDDLENKKSSTEKDASSNTSSSSNLSSTSSTSSCSSFAQRFTTLLSHNTEELWLLLTSFEELRKVIEQLRSFMPERQVDRQGKYHRNSRFQFQRKKDSTLFSSQKYNEHDKNVLQGDRLIDFSEKENSKSTNTAAASNNNNNNNNNNNRLLEKYHRAETPESSLNRIELQEENEKCIEENSNSKNDDDDNNNNNNNNNNNASGCTSAAGDDSTNNDKSERKFSDNTRVVGTVVDNNSFSSVFIGSDAAAGASASLRRAALDQQEEQKVHVYNPNLTPSASSISKRSILIGVPLDPQNSSTSINNSNSNSNKNGNNNSNSNNNNNSNGNQHHFGGSVSPEASGNANTSTNLMPDNVTNRSTTPPPAPSLSNGGVTNTNNNTNNNNNNINNSKKAVRFMFPPPKTTTELLNGDGNLNQHNPNDDDDDDDDSSFASELTASDYDDDDFNLDEKNNIVNEESDGVTNSNGNNNNNNNNKQNQSPQEQIISADRSGSKSSSRSPNSKRTRKGLRNGNNNNNISNQRQPQHQQKSPSRNPFFSSSSSPPPPVSPPPPLYPHQMKKNPSSKFLVAVIRALPVTAQTLSSTPVTAPIDNKNNSILLDQTTSFVESIYKNLIITTGAHIIEFRNDFFIVALRLSEKRMKSKLAQRFVKNLMTISDEMQEKSEKQEEEERQKHKLSQQQQHSRQIEDVSTRENENDDRTTLAKHSHVKASTVDEQLDEENLQPPSPSVSSPQKATPKLFLCAGLAVGHAGVLRMETSSSAVRQMSSETGGSCSYGTRFSYDSLGTATTRAANGTSINAYAMTMMQDDDDDDDLGSYQSATISACHRHRPPRPTAASEILLRPFSLIGKVVSDAVEAELVMRTHLTLKYSENKEKIHVRNLKSRSNRRRRNTIQIGLDATSSSASSSMNRFFSTSSIAQTRLDEYLSHGICYRCDQTQDTLVLPSYFLPTSITNVFRPSAPSHKVVHVRLPPEMMQQQQQQRRPSSSSLDVNKHDTPFKFTSPLLKLQHDDDDDNANRNDGNASPNDNNNNNNNNEDDDDDDNFITYIPCETETTTNDKKQDQQQKQTSPTVKRKQNLSLLVGWKAKRLTELNDFSPLAPAANFRFVRPVAHTVVGPDQCPVQMKLFARTLVFPDEIVATDRLLGPLKSDEE